ncbi:MAG: zinc ribbon domain-containing protein [Polyangiaceae bacterium]
MSSDPVKRCLAAIDERDAEAIESLRGVVRGEHLDAILDTWRASLPWDAKDLYAALLMDQKSERIELLMRDALSSPSVETRAYAVCYLLGSFSHFDSLLAGGGWVDPVKVDAAIARWRATTGTPDKPPTCENCGAPLDAGAAKCGFCGRVLRVQEGVQEGALPNNVRFVLQRHWQMRVGQGESDETTVITKETRIIPPGPVTMTLKAIEGEFGIDALLVRLLFTTTGAPELMTAKTSAVNPTNNLFSKTWNITKRGDFEIHVLDASAQHVLGVAKFRVVG